MKSYLKSLCGWTVQVLRVSHPGHQQDLDFPTPTRAQTHTRFRKRCVITSGGCDSGQNLVGTANLQD